MFLFYFSLFIYYLMKINTFFLFIISNVKSERHFNLNQDINISLKESGSSKLGTKVEIKNLNSISNIQKGIEFEINRQKSLIENGKKM